MLQGPWRLFSYETVSLTTNSIYSSILRPSTVLIILPKLTFEEKNKIPRTRSQTVTQQNVFAEVTTKSSEAVKTSLVWAEENRKAVCRHLFSSSVTSALHVLIISRLLFSYSASQLSKHYQTKFTSLLFITFSFIGYSSSVDRCRNLDFIRWPNFKGFTVETIAMCLC